MKKLLPMLVFLLAICGFLFSQTGEQVYIVGTDGNDAVYWLNGQRHVLPKTGNRASANAVAVSGPDVYIAGRDGDDAVYWRGGHRHVLPKTGKNAIARSIAVSGTDVYIA
jgi:hypothetical protein